jgi:hypothetical protein
VVLRRNAPAAPFALGPFRWHASGSCEFRWNLKQGAVSFRLPGGVLKDSGNSVPGWPDGGLSPSNYLQALFIWAKGGQLAQQ